MSWSMVLIVLLVLLLLLREGALQDDFSGKGKAENDITLLDGRASGKERTAVGGFEGQIKCYTCEGTAENSTCSDPVNVSHDSVGTKVCDRGICLKWTKYRGGVLQMIRTCSADLDFHLTMIDGVCRTERNGNGFLCMCGKHLCNSASGQRESLGQWTIILMSVFLLCCDLIFQRVMST